MSKVNSITICRDNFGTVSEWEDAVKRMVMSLLENHQIMTVRYDESGLGIIIIEFEHDDPSMGCRYPRWLTPEEEETVFYGEG